MLCLKKMCYNGKNIYKEVTKMTVSYKKLWKLLIDRDMKKKDLQAAAGISPSSISKLSKNKFVSMEVLVKVCTALGVDFKDIMELVPNMVEERK
jgi:DNA-binding Xre family transcriptional regulator